MVSSKGMLVKSEVTSKLAITISFFGIFSTSVYRKPTFTGLFTNFDSFIPISYKRGLINTLLFRYFNISSSYAIFHAEVEKFKKIIKVF